MRLSPNQQKKILIGATAIAAVLAVVIVALAIVAEQSLPARAGSAGDEALASSTTSATAAASLATPAPAAVATAVLSPHGAPLDAYQGLASWVDVYDTPAWRNPKGAVLDMARHGVRTLFVQTSHYNSATPFCNVKALCEFIAEGHAHGMKVVAWYLPNMKPRSVDYKRVVAAVNLRTADGQAFDSFALDIESNAVKSEAMRNRYLKALSLKMRAAVGPTYPLGAIIPAPVALRKENSLWHNFPYTMLAGIYDVFVPMGYYTYDGTGASTAYSDVRSNLAILRSQRGCAQTPIHLIGGIAEDSSRAQVDAFVQGAREGKVLGASLYGWAGTSRVAWKSLSAIKR